MRRLDFKISGKNNGISVETFLRGEKGFSKRLITKLKQIQYGILKNGVPSRTIDKVYENDILSVAFCDNSFLEPNPELDIPIAYEDDDVIVFNKPVNMPVHPSIKHQGDTLGNFFSAHCEGLTFRPVNRLDRDTSGLCVCAKNSHSANIIQKTLKKTYVAIVKGKVCTRGTINAPIGREDNSIILRKVTLSGQPAVTNYELLEYNRGNSVVKINLETGRTHQIRVHFAFIGHPLIGDDMYGGDTSVITNQALHCKDVEFFHPVKNKIITVTSELRKEMIDFLKYTEKED